jgi:hypothetical protein
VEIAATIKDVKIINNPLKRVRRPSYNNAGVSQNL